jgi:hypothetical protein
LQRSKHTQGCRAYYYHHNHHHHHCLLWASSSIFTIPCVKQITFLGCSFTAILYLQFMVLVTLFPMLTI